MRGAFGRRTVVEAVFLVAVPVFVLVLGKSPAVIIASAADMVLVFGPSPRGELHTESRRSMQASPYLQKAANPFQSLFHAEEAEAFTLMVDGPQGVEGRR